MDSSDGKPSRRYLQWDATKRSVKVTSEMLARAERMRFKRRGDLINLHKYPGALGALFLLQVRSRLSKGPTAELTDLRRLDTQAWTDGHSGLKELREFREVREVQAAKRGGGSWERAELVSLCRRLRRRPRRSHMVRWLCKGHHRLGGRGPSDPRGGLRSPGRAGGGWALAPQGS